MTLQSRDPAIFGRARFGHSRVGVYTSKWERLLLRHRGAYRSLTHRIYSAPSADSTTGHRPAVFTDESIDGMLIEAGGAVPGFAATLGVRMKKKALVLSLILCDEKHRIFDSLSRHEWEVDSYDRVNDPQTYYDGSGNELVSLAFYAIHLDMKEKTSQIAGAI